MPDNRGNGAENPGSLSGVIPAEKLGRHPGAPYEQKWKRGRIIAYPDGKVEHWLNGKLVLEYTRGSDEFNALLAGSEHPGLEGFGTEARSPIAIRGQEGAVRFRLLLKCNFNGAKVPPFICERCLVPSDNGGVCSAENGMGFESRSYK